MTDNRDIRPDTAKYVVTGALCERHIAWRARDDDLGKTARISASHALMAMGIG